MAEVRQTSQFSVRCIEKIAISTHREEGYKPGPQKSSNAITKVESGKAVKTFKDLAPGEKHDTVKAILQTTLKDQDRTKMKQAFRKFILSLLQNGQCKNNNKWKMVGPGFKDPFQAMIECFKAMGVSVERPPGGIKSVGRDRDGDGR